VKSRLATLAAGLVLGGSLLVASTGAVGAVTTPAGPAGKGVCATEAAATRTSGVVVEALRAWGNCEIDRRFDTLTALSNAIKASKVMAPSDAAALQAEISSTRSGLTSLKAAIDSETVVLTLKADIVKIATDYRVYLLVVPQVHLVNGADGILAAQARFSDVNTKLSARIAAAKAAGKDTTAAQADLDAMNAAVSKAVGLATPLPAALLALTPAQYNGGTAGPVLTNARAAIVSARDDLKSAVADAQACRTALNAL
jgi:hypothetical protein